MDQNNPFLNRKDLGWLATLFGTAVGAGILYLPVSAAKIGFFPLLIVAIISAPAIWMSHRNLTRFCLSTQHSEANITSTVTEKFGVVIGGFLIVAYFMSIFPISLLYAIGLTNVINDIIINFSHYSPPPRALTSFIILALLALIISKGEKWILTATEFLVIPLAIILLFCAAYLIPVWRPPQEISFEWHEYLQASILITPLFVFSFNHTPACSSFAQSYRKKYSSKAVYTKKINRILGTNIVLLAAVILPFVFSCVLSMTPSDIERAVQKNIPALISISAAGYISWMPYVIAGITLLAITSSFFGVYIGSLEGATGIASYTMKNIIKRPDFKLSKRKVKLTHLFLLLICWITATLDFSVINIIQTLVAPVLAILLFIMPVYAIYQLEELKHYRSPIADSFTFIFGLLVITGFIISFIIE